MYTSPTPISNYATIRSRAILRRIAQLYKEKTMQKSSIDRITENLRQRILDGEFGTAGRIPTQRTLVEQLGTTRETLYKALEILKSEGLLQARDKSIYVNRQPVRMAGLSKRFD